MLSIANSSTGIEIVFLRNVSMVKIRNIWRFSLGVAEFIDLNTILIPFIVIVSICELPKVL